jgi:hypothetical protein
MDKRFVKSDKIAAQERADETYVLTLPDTTLHHLAEIETFIWRALDAPKTGKDVAELVRAEYDVSEADAAADVEAFLSELEAAGLVTAVDDGRT